VTELFRTLEPERALDLAVTGKAVSLQSNSNYGNALAALSAGSSRRHPANHGADHRRRAKQPEPAQRLGAPGDPRKARRLVWICPEERRAWGVGDSEMDLYAGCATRWWWCNLSPISTGWPTSWCPRGALMERSGDDVAGGDARTLSFAAYRIDAALLEQLLSLRADAAPGAEAGLEPGGDGLGRTGWRSPRPGSPRTSWSGRSPSSGDSPGTGRWRRG
jgi:hypothetical protein